MYIVQKIKSNPKLKSLVHWSITPARNPKPRLWIRWFVNPFFHKRGKGSVIRSQSRLDVFPWNRFEIGELTTIEDFSVINNGSGHVLIGDRVRVGIGSVVLGPVRMGNGSGLGQHVFVAGFSHGYADATRNSSVQPLMIKETVIEDEAHIGANSVVLPGVRIGKRSQVGAGSVVTRDIPPFSIAVGNPARVIKRYDFDKGEWVKVKP
jgi:acetyltransferase-like isoleucine patch superfamily enzyme